MSDHPDHPDHPEHRDRPDGPERPEDFGYSGFTERDLQREVLDLEHRSTTAARIFDLRRIIGGLFVLYGVMVTIAGITASDAAIDKAEGVNINLWTGIGMLLLGLFFLAWLKLRPTPPLPDTAPDDRAR